MQVKALAIDRSAPKREMAAVREAKERGERVVDGASGASSLAT